MTDRVSQRLHSENEYKELLAEHQAIQRKFESKVEAVLELGRELASCQSERQLFEQRSKELTERCSAMKMALMAQKRERNRKESLAEDQQQSLAHVFKCVKEENRSLNEEIEHLRQQLDEAKCDVKLLRTEMGRKKLEQFFNDEINIDDDRSNGGGGRLGPKYGSSLTYDQSCSNSEEIIEQLEKLRSENSMLERDVKCLLCEKEELIVERDAQKTKVDRLNAELNLILNDDDGRLVDVDDLIAENRYLKERLINEQEENRLAKNTLSKYKGFLEKKRPGAAAYRSGTVPIITHKQARAFLGQMGDGMNENVDIDYRALASSLYETINDKNLALSHQRKANKILASRIAELESKLQTSESHHCKSPRKDIKACQGEETQCTKTDEQIKCR